MQQPLNSSMTPSLHITEDIKDNILKKEITVNSWKIQTIKGRIFDSKELLAASSKLSTQTPFPDMFFGYNSLVIQHSSGFKCSFSALDAFSQVGIESDLKVATSSAWISSRYFELKPINILGCLKQIILLLLSLMIGHLLPVTQYFKYINS